MQNSQEDREGVALEAREPTTHRSFLRESAFSALGAGILAACRGSEAAFSRTPSRSMGMFGMVTALVAQE